MGIHRKFGRKMKKKLEQAPDLERLAGQLFQIFRKKSKSRPEKIWNR
jgi:hypothetical protein